MQRVIESATQYLFFTGKGGVGKTTLATATAVALADRGARVLLVSTDPASNLGQVLECDVGARIAPVPSVPRLHALNIDPEAAAQAYRERVVGPVRGVLPEDAVEQMTEQLSCACTTEIAAFDEFTELLTDDSVVSTCDHAVFDTAPTGHTLRLLQLPAAWSGFIESNPNGASCLGPLSSLDAQRAQYASAVGSLGDPLRSPCTEEVAVFHAFSRIVNGARRGVVVLDTAPTGHILLLLDATGSYHREVLRNSSLPAERVITPLMRLRDPEHTRVLIVTLPETTPVLETEALQADLRRAGIEPHAWIINQSLAATDTADPLLRARATAELPLIERVQRELAQRTAIFPLQPEPPVGPQRLRALTSTAAAAVES